MNKRVVCGIAVVLLACAGTASAQIAGIGVKGGFNVANMPISSEHQFNTTLRKAWMTGGFVDFPLGRNVFLQPELVFTTKGTEIPVGVGQTTYKLTYLEIPVLLRLDLRNRGKAIPYVYAGPTVSFLLAATQTNVAPAIGYSARYDAKDQFQSTDVGFALGGGVRFGKFLVEARYVEGLKNIAKQAPSQPSTAKNRVFQIIGGVRF